MPWYSDDTFWQESWPYMFPAEAFERARVQAEKLLTLCSHSHGRVLDLACGPGRFAVPIAQRGIPVTGVDRSRFLLDRAREYIRREDVDVELVESDMREFRRDGAFSLAICMFTSFGYFEDHADNLRVAENVCHSLEEGGRFVIDLMGKEVLARIWRPTHSEQFDDGTLLIHRRTLLDDFDRIRLEWIQIRDEKITRFDLTHSLYSAHELKDLLLQAGFSRAEAYGTLAGDPYDADATRLLVVARK